MSADQLPRLHEPRLWIERLVLSNFRNHAATTIAVGPQPIVLAGANGSGKTNILEAVSLLSPGQGLRRAPFMDLARAVLFSTGFSINFSFFM